MDERDKLLTLRFNDIFESVQRDNQNKRRELAEKFGHRGLLHSGPHAKAIVELELNCIKKLLDAKLQILLEVFYKNAKPWTKNDENFLMNRIEELFTARLNASRVSLTDYLNQRGIRLHIEDFEREATSIISNIKRKIEATILENRIFYPELPDRDVNELLLMEEGNQLEFKSAFQWNIKNQCKNERLRLEVISTIAAFNNTDGGYLLIGVKDNRDVFGLERDYSLLKKSNRDGFNLLLTQEIENRLSKCFLPKVKISFHEINNKDICNIKINIGDDAIWVKENNKEIFYIRTQNSTRMLSPKESADYIRRKWKPKE